MPEKYLRTLGNLTGITVFAFLCTANLQSYQASKSLVSLTILIVNGLILTLYLTRSEPVSFTKFPIAWIMSVLGTLLPFAFRPSQETTLPCAVVISQPVQVTGLFLVLASLLSIGDSFGMIPAHREIKTRGLYRIVRHPMYTSEFIFFIGYISNNQSLYNLAIFVLLVAIQLFRAGLEERILLANMEYKEYKSKTRYKFIPLIL